MSGDGGDEAFGGYDFRYVPHQLEERLRGLLPAALRVGLFGPLGRIWPRSRRLPKALRLSTVFANVATDASHAYYADLCFLKPQETRALLGPNASTLNEERVQAGVVDVYRRCGSPDVVQKAQYADLHVYMPNDPLVKVDRMSMLHSLEVRCPLLDHRVVELAFRIPTSRKMPGMRGKHLLRQLAARRLPEGLSKLPKRGFTAPVGEWVTGPYRQRFTDDVLSPDSRIRAHVDQAVVKGFLDDQVSGSRDRSYSLWAVWVLERWLRSHEGRARGVTAT